MSKVLTWLLVAILLSAVLFMSWPVLESVVGVVVIGVLETNPAANPEGFVAFIVILLLLVLPLVWAGRLLFQSYRHLR